MQRYRIVLMGMIVTACLSGAGIIVAASGSGGLWRGVCSKCGHDWIRYVAPTEAYSVCSFRPDDRGWCNGRIIWDVKSPSR